MGQKTHPKGFRLIVNHDHLSQWCSVDNDYKELIKKDYRIRKYVEEFLNDLLTYSSITIFRSTLKKLDYSSTYKTTIKLKVLFPKLRNISKFILSSKTLKELIPFEDLNIGEDEDLDLSNFVSYFLKQHIKKLSRQLHILFNEDFKIELEFLKTPLFDAKLTAKFISEQLLNRIGFRRITKELIKKASLLQLKGIKIQISGRLNGIDMARTEWKRDGMIPLQTLCANIDYAEHVVNTEDGSLGIKVWLYQS